MTPQWTHDRDALHQEIAKLRGRVVELESEVIYFKDMMRSSLDFSRRWKLTAVETKILSILTTGGVKDRSVFMALIYDKDEPHDRILDVFISKIRRKIEPDGVRIDALWGQGYVMSDENIAKVKTLCLAPLDNIKAA